MLAGTLGKSLGKKWWHMPGPSSIWWSKIIHLLEVGHDYWWKACWSWGRRWNGTCPSLTKRSSGGWPSWRRKRRRVQRPLPPQTFPRCPMCWSLLQKREPQSFWDGRRYCIHPNQWWPLGRSPNLQRPWGQRYNLVNPPWWYLLSLQSPHQGSTLHLSLPHHPRHWHLCDHPSHHVAFWV